MRPEIFVVLSGCLTFGLPLLFAVREVIVLRRGNPRNDGPPPPPPPSSPKPLPPCLLAPFLPRAPQQRERIRELA